MNNILMLRVNLTGEYQPLVNRSLIASVEVNTPPTNAGTAFFLGLDGQDVPWVPGEWHFLAHVDLADIRVKGTPGDLVTVVGGTW